MKENMIGPDVTVAQSEMSSDANSTAVPWLAGTTSKTLADKVPGAVTSEPHVELSLAPPTLVIPEAE
jgi:hypothetical protein